jgi:predicted Zn finger-like uncharacterized protein
MKIVCQSCSAKYSIADDKVQGKKVFKIKCKKCGEDILVRGADAGGDADASASHAAYAPAQEQFSEDEATRVVSGESGDAVWHAVVDGDQQGPFTMKQLRDMMGTGAITVETFVWKDGFTDWKPMREVPELAMLTVGAAPVGGDSDLFGSPAPTPAASSGGLFASAPARSTAPASEAKARAGSKAAAGGDLFGSEAAQASAGLFGGGEEEISTSAAASPRVDAKQAMTGPRNENSVLFSLATLQQVAGAQASPAEAKVAEPGAAGKAVADQSGLIDIKSMAATFGPNANSKQKAVDDILTVGAGGGLGSPLAAPVLAPVPTPAVAAEPAKASGPNKTVLFSVVAVSLIVVGGGLGVAALMRNNNPPPAPVVIAPPPAPAPVAPVAPAPVAPAAPAAGTTVAQAEAPTAAPTATPEARPEAARTARPSAPRERPANSGSGSSAPAANTASNAGSGPSGGTCASRCRGNIDCLLRCSTEGPRGAAAAPAPAANLPEAPGRNDVLTAMRAVAGAVNECGAGQSGTATVAVTFASSGRVTTANVAPPYAGTPAGSCIARAVRGATVPAFSRPTFQVNYPFVIR